jgi:molybdopterin/thiamine biosynthesis adenylyltransferase
MSRNALFHERLYRSDKVMRRVRDARVTVCGAGALGANITEGLARQGCTRLRAIDRDRIEERNLSTQPWFGSDVGAFKAKILANSIYRALGIAVEAKAEELTPASSEALLDRSAVVIDAFDNSGSRQLVKDACEKLRLPCLHAGLSAEYAEVIWNDAYRVPSDADDDACDYPLARNLVMLTVSVACEVILRFIAVGERESYTITLRDFAVHPFIA